MQFLKVKGHVGRPLNLMNDDFAEVILPVGK